MMEEALAIADKLSDVIRNMQKCLRCTICLHTILNPMRTRCGHRFCRECIQKVLESKNSTCPLCNSVIQRRNIREDEHIEIYIDRLQKLIEAVQKDSGIDVMMYVSRRLSTLESCSSDSRDSAKQNSEEYNQPSCSYAQPKSLKKSASSRAKRAAPKSKRSRSSKGKKDDASESSNITKYFSKYTLSGVEPLRSDKTNYLDVNSTEMKVHSWFETFPGNMEISSPTRSSIPDCNLDDTLHCSISEAGEKEVDKNDLESECPEASAEIGHKRNVTLRQSSKDQKDKDSQERMIKAAVSRRASSTSAPRANDAAGRMQTSWVDRRQSASSNDKSDNDRDAVQEQNEIRRSDVQKTSPCDLLPSMKKNWSSVVQFGKEMRSKRRKKIRSLNVSIANKNKKSANESAEKSAPKQKKLPRGSIRRNVERPSVADNDANEKLLVHKDAEEQQSRDKNNGSMANATRPAGRSSFIAFDEDEQVHGRNLNNPQMNEIVEVADQQQDLEIENLSFDEDSEPKFLRKLGLHRTPPRERIETSSIDVTPVRDPTEASPNLLEGYVSPSEEVEIVAATVPQSPANFQSSTPLRSRLSLKRRDIDSKSVDPAVTGSNSRLLAVRRDLNHEISRTESIVAVPTKSANTPSEREGNNMTGNRHVEDTETRNSKGQRKSLAMFKKLGKLVKHNRKPVKFLYLGSTRPRLTTLHERIQRWQGLYNPMEHQSTPKLASENSFGNNTRFTVNNAVSSQDGTEVGLVARREEVGVDPKRKGLSESGSDSTKSIAIPVAPKIVIESMDPISKDIISATVTSQPRDSNDILFVSIYENERNKVQLVRQDAPSKTTAFNSSANMLSSKDDSQLKFLALDSPTRNTQPAEKPEQQGDKDISAKRSNLSDTRGVHSRALVRTSMQGSEEPETDVTPHRTRKKTTNQNNLVRETNRTTEENDREVGATYSKDPVACGKDDVMNYCPPSQSAQCIEIVLSSSESEIDIRACAPKVVKKVYKRIMSPDTESSSSSKRTNVPSLNQQPEISSTTKRKRSVSPDSDSYKDLDMIVDSWSKDFQPKNKFSKIGNMAINSSAATVNMGPARIQEKRLSSLDVDPNSWRATTKMGRDPSSKGSFDNDSPDFGATIDSVRNIQRAAAVATTSGDKEPTRQRSEEVACLMQDNFDEIIANVDTEQLIDDYCRPRKRKCHAGVDSARNVHEGGRFKDTSVSQLHKGSDKENEHEESGRLYDSEIDSDKTLTPEHVNAADKSSRIGDDRLRERTKPVKSTSQQPATRNTVANRLSTINPAFPGSDRVLENTVTLKETCFEQDSLMNITQHQMLIKQFEDDLFGRTTNVQLPMKPYRQQRSPKTQNWSGNVSNPDLTEKDAEHSTGEDDIVENTPNAKTKNMQPIASSVEKISTKVPMMQINRVSRSLSSELVRSTTPLSKKSRHPIYQSTPKVQGQAKDDCVGAVSPVVRQLKLGNANEPKNRPANEVSGFNGRREKLCFICSGLLATEIQQVKKLASLANASYLNQFNLRVTHVIVKADEKNSANKTLKYLQGIAHRKWVVGYQWVVESLREKKLINEERYEVVDGVTFETGARDSRLRQKELFEGFTFLCIGPYEDVSVEQYEELLSATGGTVVRTQEALAVVRTQMKLIVIHEHAHNDKIINWHKKTLAVPIVHDWILECISRYKLIPFYPYLQELLPQDVLALGYPRFLLEDEPDDEDYDTTENTFS